jgi:Protein of unknown function (DUF3551)
MKTILIALAVATVVASPVLAAAHRHASQSAQAHAQAETKKAADPKYCLKGSGAPYGCSFNSMEQCQADSVGKGGYCYEK